MDSSQPKWVIELNNGLPQKPKNASSIPDPPGFATSKSVTGKQKSQVAARKTPTPEETETLKLKKAWEVALGPAKQIPMQAIMGYMSGNSLQIFSIMMVAMLFKNPIQAIAQTNMAFSRFESPGTRSQMLGVKAVYILMQCLLLGLGVYKVHSMGLLPTTRSDWLAWEFERQPLERAYFASGR
ncbi:phosphatidylserine decarboxylase [Exophiala viscosa]|uniref:ER membrane protein complex subunit 4 n=1 Tax=Exophiala viscosa TaxID=2486360 RepID=A0AAN6E8E6_9EURO|nr:phosphatidylserine decarboxylase [Exophiala viscosa]KAI1627781.1 phosphatidylserine decarboxylase [Exophiala viscosa]